MIEVKNKYTLSKNDVDKFQSNVKSSDAVCGIIVSTREGVRFPFRKSGYDMDVITEKKVDFPCLYITDFDVSPLTLFGGILALFHYVEKNKQGDEKTQNISNDSEVKYQELVAFITTWLPIIDHTTKTVQMASESMSSLQTTMFTTLKTFIPQDEQHLNNTVLKKVNLRDRIANPIATYHIEHGKHAPMIFFETNGITYNQLNKFGGLKALRAEYNDNN